MHATLKGQYVRLEPFVTGKHAVELYTELCKNNNQDIWDLQPYGPFSSEDEFSQYFENYFGSSQINAFAIFETSEPKPLGMSAYIDIDEKNKRLEIGDVTFSSSLQKTRAATESIHLMLKYAFDNDFRRVAWKCNSRNEASKKAALRLGFKQEGTFRNHRIEKGRNRDTDWFSIIEEEWPRIYKAHENWLDENNFGPDGLQKEPLSHFFE